MPLNLSWTERKLIVLLRCQAVHRRSYIASLTGNDEDGIKLSEAMLDRIDNAREYLLHRFFRPHEEF